MPRDFKRTDRVADVMQKEISQIIRQEINDPRVGLVTISLVQVSKDLSHAKVFVSVMSETQAVETLKALNKAAGFFRGVLAKRLKMRIIPALNFVYDDTTLKAIRLSKIIDDAIADDLSFR